MIIIYLDPLRISFQGCDQELALGWADTTNIQLSVGQAFWNGIDGPAVAF